MKNYQEKFSHNREQRQPRCHTSCRLERQPDTINAVVPNVFASGIKPCLKLLK